MLRFFFLVTEAGIKTLTLKSGEDRRIRRGHPWAFSNEFETKLTSLEPGELVAVVDRSGRRVGTGYANPHSLIAVRLLCRDDEKFSAGLIQRRVKEAEALRKKLCPGRTSYRAVYSESDFLPGLVVDRYGPALCVQVLTAGMERLMPEVHAALTEVFAPETVILRNDSPLRALEGLPLGTEVYFGEYRGPAEFEVAGMRVVADLMEGQKTGFFLDQVDNYSLLDLVAPGSEVLDLFCHTGAWALYAARAGAASALGVDSSAPALALAGKAAALNSLSGRVSFMKENVFDALGGFRQEGRSFDVVVADPPAFVKGRARLAEGVKGYRDLNTKAMKAVRSGGYLISCSCSHHLTREKFMETLRISAVQAGRTARLIEMRSQSKDHPVLLAAPETSYLKCALLQIL